MWCFRLQCRWSCWESSSLFGNYCMGRPKRWIYNGVWLLASSYDHVFSFFWEQNALELMIRYIDHQTANRNICIQLLQSLNILFENLTNNRAICENSDSWLFINYIDYLLSQNHTNGIILHEFDFSDEEIIGYYIAFLKSLSFRVDNDTINFFFEEASASFPLYQRALQFFDHSESMVRIAVRTITLNIFKGAFKLNQDDEMWPYFLMHLIFDN